MGKPVPFRRKRTGPKSRGKGARDGWLSAARGLGPALFVLPIAAFTAVWMMDGPPGVEAAAGGPRAGERQHEPESARFGPCSGSMRITCVVDGDTIWYQGTKIRVADINTPEVSRPGCAHEARLGDQATARLTELLNEGSFTLVRPPGTPETDKYGRTLRELHRGGASLGAVLMDEGLAEEWNGARIDWC
ncbi:thermonuclease family protein [Altererythrobacter sp. H2]|uniref:thermonuclease family protein n=1 Tax=Altererythrobacter sp. H2 TaxID=3108391 RepID=UPI002B4BDC13|nr:thermonuclease family protein [Altererythrobacter sp. H2]WRK95684.1 thermonuclease family protein [Altererythrobacter sp. H2]